MLHATSAIAKMIWGLKHGLQEAALEEIAYKIITNTGQAAMIPPDLRY
jgi:hypothetical protein